MIIKIVAAMANGSVIGNSALHGTPEAPVGLPWKKIPSDFKRFKEITKDGILIMGSTTADLIGKPLPDRGCVVVTKDPTRWEHLDEGFCVQTIKETRSMLSMIRGEDNRGGDNTLICVIGGAQIFKEFIGQVDMMCITHIHADILGDRYFPPIDEKVWRVSKEEILKVSEKDPYDTTYREYVRV